MSLLELLKTNYDNKNIDEITRICHSLLSQDLEKKINGIAPPLLLSVYFDCHEAVKILIEKGSNVDQKSNDGNTPIFWAFVTQNEETINLILDKNPNMVVQDKNGKTPLFPICSHLNSVDYLLQAKKMIGDSKFKKECRRVSKNGLTLLSSCIECITNYKDKKDKIDLLSAQDEIISKMEILLEHGLDVRRQIKIDGIKYSLLDFISNNELIENFPDIAENLAIFLIKKGVRAKDSGSKTNLLFKFCETGNLSAVKLLIDHGFDPRKKNSDNSTCLMASLNYDNYEVANFLLDIGLDINAVNNDGMNPLFFVLKSNNDRFTKEFLSRDEIDIHHEYKKPLIVEISDINLPKNFNILHFACEIKNLNVVDILIEMGMDLNEKGNCMVSPMEILETKNLPENILDFYLKSYSGDNRFYQNLNNSRLFNDECPICLSKLSGNVAVFTCKHAFHIECIMNVLKNDNPVCPICRNDLILKYKVKLPEASESESSSSSFGVKGLKREKSMGISVPVKLTNNSVKYKKENLFNRPSINSKKNNKKPKRKTKTKRGRK